MKSVPERYQGDPDGDHLQSHRTAAKVAHAHSHTSTHTRVQYNHPNYMVSYKGFYCSVNTDPNLANRIF